MPTPVTFYITSIRAKARIKSRRITTASADILDALNKDGHISLYINFETGNSDIKPESQKIIDPIADLLLTNPALKISVEGHTDNVGIKTANQTLSENRAKAVIVVRLKFTVR